MDRGGLRRIPQPAPPCSAPTQRSVSMSLTTSARPSSRTSFSSPNGRSRSQSRPRGGTQREQQEAAAGCTRCSHAQPTAGRPSSPQAVQGRLCRRNQNSGGESRPGALKEAPSYPKPPLISLADVLRMTNGAREGREDDAHLPKTKSASTSADSRGPAIGQELDETEKLQIRNEPVPRRRKSIALVYTTFINPGPYITCYPGI